MDVKIRQPDEVINESLKATGTPLTFLAKQTGLAIDKVYRGLGSKRGKRRGYMRADELILYAVALGLTVEDFITREGDTKNANSNDSA